MEVPVIEPVYSNLNLVFKLHVHVHLYDNIGSFSINYITTLNIYRTCFFLISIGVVLVVIIWKLDLQLPMQSVPITNNVVSSNPAKTRCTRYNIMS